MAHVYLVRHGQAGAIGRFHAETAHGRGETVVVHSHRGLELGEVLIEVQIEALDQEPRADVVRVTRTATEADRDRARRADRDRNAWFEACDRLLSELPGASEINLIDVEPLLDDRRAVLHYLGPHHLPNLADWRAAFRMRLDLDVILEAAGIDITAEATTHGCGHCGDPAGGCHSDGCGTTGGGCSGCGVMKALATARAAL